MYSASLTLGAHVQEGYCSWVCLSVCLLSHISPLEGLFFLKILSLIQRTTNVKKFVGFSVKPLRCRDPVLPPLKAIRTVGHFPVDSAHAHYMHVVAPRVLHFSAFINVHVLVLPFSCMLLRVESKYM